jgi:acetyltransferase-like isoleucine patch superfamily enzyme
LGHWQKLSRRLSVPYFQTRDVQIGRGVRFGRHVEFNCRKVRIGDGCVFMDNIVVNAEEFSIGDFGTVYSEAFFPGPGCLSIGHNSWIGKGAIIDAQGGTILGNNVGVGAYSQLWSHVRFGDIALGARFQGAQPLRIDDEVWISPGCIVSPVHVRRKSMLLAGAVLTTDTEENTLYAGVPARSMEGKMAPPFREMSLEESKLLLEERLYRFCRQFGVPRQQIQVLPGDALTGDRPAIVINAATRSYDKRGTALERRLLRFLLPDIKLIPA